MRSGRNEERITRVSGGNQAIITHGNATCVFASQETLMQVKSPEKPLRVFKGARGVSSREEEI